MIMNNLKNAVVTEIINAITVHSVKGRYENIYNRRWYGLSFCTDGQITYTHNGKSFVSDNKHAIILPQNGSYTLYGNREGLFPLINFFCKDILTDTFLSVPIENPEIFMAYFEQIKSLLLFDENHAKVMSIFYNMLHRLTSHTHTDNTILPALKFIEKNYNNPLLTNTLIADECNISEVYLRKLFSKHLKTTPKQYISDIRLQKAKHLLSEGILKINAVAENCGFSNPYHFCRVFKEKTGLTPTEYIKQNKISKI